MGLKNVIWYYYSGFNSFLLNLQNKDTSIYFLDHFTEEFLTLISIFERPYTYVFLNVRRPKEATRTTTLEYCQHPQGEDGCG